MNKRTCNRCNTPLNSGQAKYCSHSCANRVSAAAHHARSEALEQKACDVDGCDKPARSKKAELCKMHYHRLYRYGTLETSRVLVDRGEREPAIRRTDLRGVRFGTLVAEEPIGEHWLCRCDCGAMRTTRIGDLRRTGDSNTCGVKANHLSDAIDYNGAHDRVKRLYGPASQHACVGCGSQARHWSYDHADPDERLSVSHPTRGIAFSLDTDHYQPRCVPCHKRFDLDHINATEVYA